MDAIWIGVSVIVGAVMGYNGGLTHGIKLGKDSITRQLALLNKYSNGVVAKAIGEAEAILEKKRKEAQ